LSADKKSVLLVMPDIQPVMQMKIGMNIDAADGAAMKYDVIGTINRRCPTTSPSRADHDHKARDCPGGVVK
jgi:hypothetical protein